jgi:hypothetical protein
MSIFEDGSTNEVDLSSVTAETLVGENQKYKTVDDLAKAYANADHFIGKTKAEIAEAKAEIKVLKDLLESKNKPVEPPKAPATDSGQQNPPVNPGPDENDKNKDLSALVAEELERQNSQKTFADNVNTVSEKLASFYGGEREAKEAIARKSKELNVSTEWLMDIAGRSPNAFYNTIGLDQKSFTTPGASGDVNTAALGRDGNRKNFKYFEEIRKTNPKLYYSAQTQREMFNSARELGDKFYT